MKAKEFIIEYKKDRKAPKYSLKPRSPVAHAAQSVISGSGPHKDKKKAEKQGMLNIRINRWICQKALEI
jgi:hypothetical protein